MSISRKVFLKRSVVGLAVLLFLASTNSWAAPMGDTQFVDVDGIRTGYVEGGSGEALVLIHGGGFGSSSHFSNNWRPIFDHLTPHFHVYAIDKLGQGYTDNPRSDAQYTMEAVIRHVYRFIETLGIQKVHLAGHSRGALPAARIATDHPEMVQNLILFNSRTLAPDQPAVAGRNPAATPALPAESPTPTKESIREFWLTRSYHHEFLTDEYVEAELRVSSLPKLQEAAERMNFLTSQWVKRNPEKMQENPRLRGRWWYDKVKQETLDRIRAGDLKTPTLLLWAHNDPPGRRTFGISLYNIISSVVDRTHLHVFNQCGHYAFAEYPREVADQIISFIRRREAYATN